MASPRTTDGKNGKNAMDGMNGQSVIVRAGPVQLWKRLRQERKKDFCAFA
jgi:hypothetical protein